ncbi:MAG: hypothetical protein LH473_11875 [Chitinophagales bacterium]|nr:hypothetical protein [Chitinophagales bacterium]
MKVLQYISIVVLTVVIFSACKKDEQIAPVPGMAKIEFNHVVGASDLTFNSVVYTNSSAETFTISKLRYYVSNIQFTKDDNTVFVEPESYHLIDAKDENTDELTISNVPDGNYTSITFMIGVDSTRNVSGAQTGALDPLNDMFWDWNSGYIFFKMEGDCDQAGSFIYHVGGYSGKYAAQRMVTVLFNGNKLTVAEGKIPQLLLHVDVASFFSTPNTISIVDLTNSGSAGATSSMLADQYAGMFAFDKIQN